MTKEPTHKSPRPVERAADLDYGMFRIVAGVQGNTCKAIAFSGRKIVETAEAESVDTAIDSLKRALDERTERLAAERSEGVPRPREFADAINSLPPRLQKRARELLTAHSRQPKAVASLWELARRLGRDTEKTTSDYAAVCRSFSTSLGFAPPKDDALGKLSPMLVVAHVDLERDPQEPSFKLRDEVINAIALVEERT